MADGAMSRVSRDEYYLRIAVDVAKRSTCLRRQIGAVVVNGDVIVSTGYNGNPRNMPHCEEIGCVRDELKIPSGERMEICTGVHAEMNALLFAGKEARGGALYTTIVPCNTCAKMIINSGIRRVVYAEGYPDKMGFVLLEEAGIPVERMPIELEEPLSRPEEETLEIVQAGSSLSMEEMREALARKEQLMAQIAAGKKSINEVAADIIQERVANLKGGREDR
ncbi:MAG: cytidine/deoxycytidylate deaminase family protein [Thermoplasmata archaeon]